MESTAVIEDLKELQEALDHLDFWLIGFDNGLVDAASAQGFAKEAPLFFELCRKAQGHLNALMQRDTHRHMVSYLEETESLIQNVVVYVVHKLASFGLVIPEELRAA